MGYGANRVDFSTSRRGGSKDRKKVTGAKCLLFFEYKGTGERKNSGSKFTIDYIAGKMLCLERMEVKMLGSRNFDYQVKDQLKGCYYGTKEGNPILEFTPNGHGKSKGTEKHRPRLIISRALKLLKYFQGLRVKSGRQHILCCT